MPVHKAKIRTSFKVPFGFEVTLTDGANPGQVQLLRELANEFSESLVLIEQRVNGQLRMFIYVATEDLGAFTEREVLRLLGRQRLLNKSMYELPRDRVDELLVQANRKWINTKAHQRFLAWARTYWEANKEAQTTCSKTPPPRYEVVARKPPARFSEPGP